jgi:hypothetical protein
MQQLAIRKKKWRTAEPLYDKYKSLENGREPLKRLCLFSKIWGVECRKKEKIICE